MGTAGLALSTAICSYVQVAILLCVLRKKFAQPILTNLPVTLLKTLAATAAMFIIGLAVMLACRNLPYDRLYNISRLAVTVPAAAATYILAAKVLKIKMLSLLISKKT